MTYEIIKIILAIIGLVFTGFYVWLRTDSGGGDIIDD